jgi:hypothetical protein
MKCMAGYASSLREKLEILIIFQSAGLQWSCTMMTAAKAGSGRGRKVSMSLIGKAAIGKAVLFLAATWSVLAVAQAPQTSPTQKPSPATSASPAPAGQPRVQVSPYAQRLANSQNQFRSNQPINSAQPAARPVIPQPVIAPAVQPRPAPPQPIQPAIPAPVVAQPPVQQPVAQPVVAASSNGGAAVDYSHGQLTVVSERATLGEVLKLVAAKTGGVVDVAPELQNEPVVARLGPGPVREVLTGLLDSPKVDYIVMGTADSHSGLQRIVVRTRQSFGRTAMAAVHPALTQPQPEEQAKADETGHPPNGPTPAEAKLTQEQLMENWKKTREQMRVAEIQQQAQERENEQNHPQVEPEQPQPEQPTEPPPPPDNPPQR